MARVDISSETLDDLKAKLLSDAYTAVDAARMLGELDQAAVKDTRVIVTIYDKFYRRVGECGNYLEMNCSFPRNKVETGKLVVAREDPMADRFLTCHDETVPITIELGNLLWSGRVKIAHDDFNNPTRGDVVECELEGDYAWLMKVVAWPNALFPVQLQFPPRGFAIGPAITCLKFLIGTQFFRLQAGLWDLVNNALSLNLDWRTWFGTMLMQDLGDDGPTLDDVFRALRTPVYVIPTNALLDTSPLVSINWRMDKLGMIIDQTAKDNGLAIEVKLWRPGDPQPTDNDPLLDLFPLTVPTLVVDIKDRMGIIGPTGTFIDGILRVLVDLSQSVFGEILDPFLNPNNEYKPDGWNIAPLIGVDFVEPWTIFNADHPQGGVSGRLSHHHPESWRVIIGGKSPKWLNDLFNATFSFILDMLMIIVGLTGVPSNLFDGLFNDVLLSFALADNMNRRIELGPYGYPETFVPTQSPYNVDGIFAMKREMWNTRGYISGQVVFRNGEPYEVGRDVFPGGLATIVRNGQIYTDYIENIVITDTREERAEVRVQIGDGQAEEAPIVKLQRKLLGYEEAINILTLATQ